MTADIKDRLREHLTTIDCPSFDDFYAEQQEQRTQAADRIEQLERDLAEARNGHARYEYVRKLNVPQFTELYRTHITGLDRFDDLVDAAIAKDKQ